MYLKKIENDSKGLFAVGFGTYVTWFLPSWWWISYDLCGYVILLFCNTLFNNQTPPTQRISVDLRRVLNRRTNFLSRRRFLFFSLQGCRKCVISNVNFGFLLYIWKGKRSFYYWRGWGDFDKKKATSQLARKKYPSYPTSPKARLEALFFYQDTFCSETAKGKNIPDKITHVPSALPPPHPPLQKSILLEKSRIPSGAVSDQPKPSCIPRNLSFFSAKNQEF